MPSSKSNNNPKSNSSVRIIDGKRCRRQIVGYRQVAMTADQVDAIARDEGRGNHPNVSESGTRCPWCFLKLKPGAKHVCGMKPRSGRLPVGGPVRKVPIYQWVPED